MRLWLWIVQPNPQGWSQGWRWAGVGAVMFALYLIAEVRWRSGVSTLQYEAVSEPTWVREAISSRSGGTGPSRMVVRVEFSGDVKFEQGLGWQRWKAEPVLCFVHELKYLRELNEDGRTLLIAPEELELARRTSHRLEPTRKADAATEESNLVMEAMLREGRMEEFHGAWAFYGTGTCGVLGVAIMAGSFLVGAARLGSRAMCRRRLRRLREGLCPKCRYPFPVGTRPVCSECGLDIAVDDRATRERLGVPFEDPVQPSGVDMDEGELDKAWVDDKRVWGGEGGGEGPLGNDSVQGAGR